MSFQQVEIGSTRKLTSLITVANDRLGLRKCSLHGIQDEGDLHRLIELPREHVTRIPVQNGNEVEPALRRARM